MEPHRHMRAETECMSKGNKLVHKIRKGDIHRIRNIFRNLKAHEIRIVTSDNKDSQSKLLKLHNQYNTAHLLKKSLMETSFLCSEMFNSVNIVSFFF